MSQPIRIGLLRLVDSAPVLVAQQRGIFGELGLDVPDAEGVPPVAVAAPPPL